MKQWKWEKRCTERAVKLLEGVSDVFEHHGIALLVIFFGIPFVMFFSLLLLQALR